MFVSFSLFSGCQRKVADRLQVDSPEKQVKLGVKNSDADLEQFLRGQEQRTSDLDQSEARVALVDDSKTQTISVNQSELKAFRTEALKGCDEKLNGCKNIESLKLKPNSATLLILGLATESDIKAVDLVIRLSLEVRTRTTDDRFQRLFMLTVLSHLKPLLQIDTSLYTRIVISNVDSLRLLSETELLNLFSDFNIFDLKELDVPRSIKIKFLGFVLSKPSMIEKNSEFIKNSIVRSDIYKYILSLDEKKNSFLKFSEINAIGVSPVEFILVSYSSGAINSAEARELTAMLSNKSTEQKNLITNFMRAQTLFTSHLANLNFKAELPKFLKFTDVNVFLDLCSNISVKNRALWRSYLLALENANLISKVFSSTNSELKELIDQSKKNIQYMSSHPHLALLSYFIAKNEMVMEFKFIGVFKIHYKSVMSMFLSGELNTLMSYFDHSTTLSTNDVVVSMYYAFRSGLFDELELNPYDFINEFTKTLLADEIYRFKIDSKKWRSLSNGSGFLDKVADINESFKTNKFMDIHTSWDAFGLDPIYGDYITQLFGQATLCSFRAGTGDCKMTPGRDDGYNLFANTPLTFRSEVLKNFVSGRRSIIAALVDALKFAEIENGKSKEEIEKKLAQSTPLFDEFNLAYKEFVKDSLDFSTKYFRIVNEMVENSRKAKVQIFMTELQHLKNVHKLMVQIRSGGNSSESQKYLSSVNGHVDLSKYRTAETIDANGYSATLIDHVFRMMAATANYIGKDKSKYSIVNLTDQKIYLLQNMSNTDKKMILNIQYKEKLQDFLMEGMAQLIGFANGRNKDANAWFGIENTANLIFQVSYFGGYEAQFFAGIGAVYTLSELFGFNYNAAQLLKDAKSSYDILNARDSEMEFYKYTNSKGYFVEYYPEGLEVSQFPTYDFKSGQPRPIMDHIFLTIAQPTVNMGVRNLTGSANGVSVSAGWGLPDFKTDLINLYKSNKYRGQIFFKMNAELSSKIEESYITLLKASDKAVRNLQRELELHRNDGGLYGIDYTNRVNVPIFDFRHVEDYNRHIEEFNYRTEDHFKKYLEKN